MNVLNNFWKRVFRTLFISLLFCAVGLGIFVLFLEISLRCSLLQALNLPLTPDHILRARDLMRVPAADDIPSSDPKEFFAEGVAYDELLDDGKISISIYRERIQKIPGWAEDVERIKSRALKSDVHLRILSDVDDFQDALMSDDLVLFSGHSNLGQGLTIRSIESQTNTLWQIKGAVLPPIPEKYLFTSENVTLGMMPSIENKVFIHLGCRSRIYYSLPLLTASPETFFLFTNYEWAPGTELGRAVDLLCQTLEKRQHVETLTEKWEELYKAEILTGRSRQIRKYPDENGFSDTLFTTHAPKQ